MLRRTIREIITAHRFDQARKDCYVEGDRDQAFVLSLLGNDKDPNARVLTIDTVDVPEVTEGGNRARLMHFAASVEKLDLAIAYFADLDFDAVIATEHPANGWFTDGRDLGGYPMDAECFAKLTRYFPGTPFERLAEIRSDVVLVARQISAIRLASQQEGLNFPFQNTRLTRALDWSGGRPRFDVEHYVSALMQNASVSLSRLDELMDQVAAAGEQLKDLPDLVVVHEADTFRALDMALREMGADISANVLWAAFDGNMIARYPRLSAVLTFLRKV